MALEYIFTWRWVSGSLLFTLSYLVLWREWMRNEQLYSVDNLPNATASGIDCSGKYNQKYRTLTGICNSFEYPDMGSIGTRFAKNHPMNNTYGETENDTLLIPNPRNVARNLLWQTDEREQVKAKHLNLFVASWIQFMVHDWVKHNVSTVDTPIRVPIDDIEDPLFGQVTELEIERTAHNTYGDKDGDENRPNPMYNNIATSWWDAGQLYGADQETNDLIRHETDTAKLKINYDSITNEYRLPIGDDGNEIAGESQDWWLGLSLCHKLFTLEHNYIVDEIRKEYGTMYDDEELYHITRLIISGTIAKIHTVEWTPAILYTDSIKLGLDSNFYGEVQLNWLLNKKQAFAGAKFDFIRNEDNGSILDRLRILFNIEPNAFHPDAKRNFYNLKYYQFTESFVAVYRLHSLIPDNITINDDTISSFNIMLHNGSISTQDQYSAIDIMRAFGYNNPTALYLNGYAKFFTDIFIERFNKHIDLSTYDVIRQRERGVPRYNTFREGMNMPKITNYSQLTDNDDLIAKVSSVYSSIDEVDMLVGMFLENEGGKRVPPGWIFGETQFAVFVAAASNRLKMDRFYTDNFNADYYTQWGIDYITNIEVRDIILRHFPDLDGYIPENAFFTWHDTKQIEPKLVKYSFDWNVSLLNYVSITFIFIVVGILSYIYICQSGNVLKKTDDNRDYSFSRVPNTGTDNE